MASTEAHEMTSHTLCDLGVHGNNDLVHLNDNIDPRHPKSGHFLVPRSPTRLFTGRHEALRRLVDVVNNRLEKNDKYTRIAISGPGGIGKSELCLQLIDKVRTRFENIFWVDVGTQQATEQGFKNISDHLKIHAQSCQQAVQHLSGTQHTWMLILDNANDPTRDFRPFFPSSSCGTVVVASRNPECGRELGHEHWEQLGVLDHSQSTDLLMRAANRGFDPGERRDAEKIADALGCHTLAVVLAGSCIGKTNCRMEKYLRICEKDWDLTVTFNPDQEEPRYETVYVAFEALMVILEREDGEASCDALELVQTLSALAASNIILPMFTEAWSAISIAARTNKSGGRVKQMVALLEHVVRVRDNGIAEDHPNRLASQHELARAYRADGQVEQAIVLLEHIVEVECGILAKNHPSRLASQHELGCAYQMNGQTKQAIALLKHVVTVEKGSLAEDHPSRLTSQHALASTYLADGQPKRGISLLQHVVKIRQSRLAGDHPDRLASEYELASACQAYGQVGKGSVMEAQPSWIASRRPLPKL